MLDTDYQKNFRNQRIDTRNNNISKNTLNEYTIKTINTNPNKNSKNRSKSNEYSKSQKSNNFKQNVFTKTSIKQLRVHSLDLRREVDDPINDYVKDEIERVIHFYKQVEQLNSEFTSIEK